MTYMKLSFDRYRLKLKLHTTASRWHLKKIVFFLPKIETPRDRESTVLKIILMRVYFRHYPCQFCVFSLASAAVLSFSFSFSLSRYGMPLSIHSGIGAPFK